MPRARLPLHIFEPRYLAMLDDALKTRQRLIGMIQPVEAQNGAQAGLYKIGCAGRVTSFTETDDGRYMISLTGISRFRVVSEQEGFTPYLKAEVAWSEFSRDLGAAEEDPRFDRGTFLTLLGKFFDARGLSADWDSLREAEDELLINSLSMLSPFEVEDKQALLEAPTLEERRKTLITLIEFALHRGSDEEIMQ